MDERKNKKKILYITIMLSIQFFILVAMPVSALSFHTPGGYIYIDESKVSNGIQAITDNIDVIVGIKANNPPTMPIISGPKNGTHNVIFEYNTVSTDLDFDYIMYNISWGDSLYYNSIFYPSGIPAIINHTWAYAGVYKITVKAYDNQSESGIASLNVLIDAWWVSNIGYLIDTNNDGTYDNFYSNETRSVTEIEKAVDGKYFINNDDDLDWDGSYDIETDTFIEYNNSEETVGEEGFYLWYVFLIVVILIVLILLFGCFRKKK